MQLNPTHLERLVFEIGYWLGVGLFVVLTALAAIFSIWWLLVLALIAVALLVWSGWIEPRWLHVTTYDFALVEEAKATLKVAFISDLHAGTGKGSAFFQRVAERINELKPDLVILGGDLVEEYTKDMVELEPLKRVKAKLGKFFILGNHDFMDRPQVLRKQMEAWGFVSVENRALGFEKDGQPFELVGLEDCWYGLPQVDLLQVPKKVPRLLAIHEPDNLFDVEAGQVDLAVLGHTHGGQVRLPVIGPVGPLPMFISTEYDRGLRRWKETPVVISQGIGESTGRTRFFCRPEIVVMQVGI